MGYYAILHTIAFQALSVKVILEVELLVNLLLTLFSGTEYNGSIIFKSGDCPAKEDVELHSHVPRTKIL